VILNNNKSVITKFKPRSKPSKFFQVKDEVTVPVVSLLSLSINIWREQICPITEIRYKEVVGAN